MNSAYLLVPLTIFLLTLYSLSVFLVRLSFLTQMVHQKIWNSALLVSFLGTALLGFLIAIQISYKIEWSFSEELLKWHVHSGIALTIVALIHFFRHTGYYLRLFRTDRPAEENEPTPVDNAFPEKNHLPTWMVLSGFLSTCIQVLLIREITTVFQGNELMMSWSLGAWMLLTGIGTFLGRTAMKYEPPREQIAKALLLLIIMPVCLVPLLEILKSELFLPGVMVNPAWFLLILLVFLAPICLLTGFIYSRLVHSNSQGSGGFSRVYAFEAFGSLAGGLMVSFLMVQWFSVIQSLLILLVMTALIAVIVVRAKKYLITLAVALVTTVASLLFPVDNWLKSFLFVNQKVLETRETFYGNLTVTENAGQFNFFVNGTLLSCSDDPITSEEYAHYAMMQHRNPKNILLVSGSATGILSEILKYKSVENIECLELNPKIKDMASRYLALPSDPRISFVFDDGRRSIQTSQNRYDVVVFAIPDPSSLQFNRYYTDDFLFILKQKLNTGAIVLYGIQSSGNYLGEARKKIETSVFQTLKKNFMYTEIIPGERDYLLASDFTIRTDISMVEDSSGIDTKYVNSYYTDERSIQQRGRLIRENLGEKIINRDERPLPVFYHTKQFIAGYTTLTWPVILLPALLLLAPLFFMRTVSMGMYFSGFTASSFEILLIFTFQTYFGYVYSAIGLIIALFMGGLVLGSLWANRVVPGKKQFVLSQISLAFFALLFIAYWNLQSAMHGSQAGLVLFCLLTVVISMITGFQYVIGSKILPGNISLTAPMLYSVDLIGAALGTTLITVLLLPLVGVIYSCFIMAALNLLISMVMVLKKS